MWHPVINRQYRLEKKEILTLYNSPHHWLYICLKLWKTIHQKWVIDVSTIPTELLFRVSLCKWSQLCCRSMHITLVFKCFVYFPVLFYKKKGCWIWIPHSHSTDDMSNLWWNPNKHIIISYQVCIEATPRCWPWKLLGCTIILILGLHKPTDLILPGKLWP